MPDWMFLFPSPMIEDEAAAAAIGWRYGSAAEQNSYESPFIGCVLCFHLCVCIYMVNAFIVYNNSTI